MQALGRPLDDSAVQYLALAYVRSGKHARWGPPPRSAHPRNLQDGLRIMPLRPRTRAPRRCQAPPAAHYVVIIVKMRDEMSCALRCQLLIRWRGGTPEARRAQQLLALQPAASTHCAWKWVHHPGRNGPGRLCSKRATARGAGWRRWCRARCRAGSRSRRFSRRSASWPPSPPTTARRRSLPGSRPWCAPRARTPLCAAQGNPSCPPAPCRRVAIMAVCPSPPARGNPNRPAVQVTPLHQTIDVPSLQRSNCRLKSSCQSVPESSWV